MSLGALGYIGYGIEATEGTLVAPTIYIPVSSFSPNDENKYMSPAQIRQSRDPFLAMASAYGASAAMEMELIPVDTLSLIKSALAATVVTSAYAGGGYQHVFTPGNTSSTFTFEESAAGILVMRYGGIRVNDFEIKGAFDQIVTATFALEGTTRAKQSGVTTPSYQNVNPLHFTGASVQIAGADSASVKDFSWKVGNGLKQIGTLRKTRSFRRTDMGERKTDLSLNLDFQDTAEYDRFLADQFFAITLDLAGDLIPSTTNDYRFVINMPKVKYSKTAVPLKAGDYISQSVDCTILAAPGVPAFTLTVISSDPTVA